MEDTNYSIEQLSEGKKSQTLWEKIQELPISGTVAETINQLSSSTNPKQPGIKELLTQLKNAIADSSDLDNEDKEEAVEHLQAIAQSALDPQNESKKKGLRKAIKFFQRTVAILPAGAALTTICNTILPKIANLFGIGD